jgi:hypothetical protein
LTSGSVWFRYTARRFSTTCSRSSARGTRGPPQSWQAAPSPVSCALAPHSAHTIRDARRPHDFGLGERDFDDDQRPAARNQLIERSGLRNSSRKAVEQAPHLRVVLLQAFVHQSHDHVVLNEAAAFHDGTNFPPQWGRRLNGLAEHRAC